MEKINNIVEKLSNGIYWILIGIIVALIIAAAALFLYAFFVKKKNEHKHATAVRNAFATWMTGGLLSLIAIVFFASGQSGISVMFVESYFVIFFFSSLIVAFKIFGAKTKNSDSNNLKIDITTLKFIDLGLPSGKLWAMENVKDENGDEVFSSFDDSVNTFGKNLPSKEDWKELFDNSSYSWNEERKGYDVTGPNGSSIFLPAAGYRYGDSVDSVGSHGYYSSSSVDDEYGAYFVYFTSGGLYPQAASFRYYGVSVRLVR